jgi:hypothetical protein
MKALIRSEVHKLWMASVGGLFLMMFCLPATATLGGDLSSVQADTAHLKGAVKIQQMDGYSVHQITDARGTAVREYVAANGKVFGLAWQGPFLPEMKQILGAYLPQYSTALSEQHAKYVGRRPVSIHQPGLVVEMSGHMRAYYGRAFVPSLVPQGLDTGEVR